MESTASSISRRRVAVGLLALIAATLVATVSAIVGPRLLDSQRAMTPFPIPLYTIEAKSGNHTATLLNLGLPNVGAPQVPIPVDVDGDLIPDVEVGVNLINAEGLLNNPPQIGAIIAPNIEINRLPILPNLFVTTPDLRINIKVTIIDLEGTEPNMVARFGYDTGEGGSIPPAYKMIAGGLENMFDPVTAAIDTTGGYVIGLDPGLPDIGLGPVSSAYEGPLSTWVQFDWGTKINAAADLRFEAQPDLLEFAFGYGDGQHFTIAHGAPEDVYMTTKATVHTQNPTNTDSLDVKAEVRLDRLPREIAFDMDGSDGVQSFDYSSQSGASGRLPDLAADVDLRQKKAGVVQPPLIAHADVEAIPQQMSIDYGSPGAGAMSAEFSTSGQGIGAVEARIKNFDGEPTTFKKWVPSEQQYLNLQAGGLAILKDETYIATRIERVRHAKFQSDADGAMSGEINVGDGERPLEVHGGLDLRKETKPLVDVTANIQPLPDSIKFTMDPPPEDDQTSEPTLIEYESSESVDIDVDMSVAMPTTLQQPTDVAGDTDCGDADTICANLDIRHVPAKVTARLFNLEGEMKVEVDAPPRANGAPMDLFASATLGPISSIEGPASGFVAAPIQVDFGLQGVPSYVRIRTKDGADQTLERLDVHACNRIYEDAVNVADRNTCVPGTESEVGEIAFRVRNFKDDDSPRPVPAPSVLDPLRVTVTARGVPNQPLVYFEATGRFTDIKELRYLNFAGDLMGVRLDLGTEMGDPQDFRTLVDIDGVDLNGVDDPDDVDTLGGVVDINADVKITPLPLPIDFCMSGNGREIPAEATDALTAVCESEDPFGDGSLTETSPMTFHYKAPSAFTVETDFSVEGDLPFEQPELPIGFGEFNRVAAQLSLATIPGEFTGLVQTPVETDDADAEGSEDTTTRISTHAPGANDLNIHVGAQLTTAGVDCDDPRPNQEEAGAVCATVDVNKLPTWASIISTSSTDPDGSDGGDDALTSQAVRFDACRLLWDGDSFECQADQIDPATGDAEDSIGLIEAGVRVLAGDPAGVPTYIVPSNVSGPLPHVVVLAQLEDLDNLEAKVHVRIEDIHAVRFSQNPEGMSAHSNIGSGEDFKIYALADLRDANDADLIPDALRARIIGDIDILPMPQVFDFTQTGPGPSQDEPVVVEMESSERAIDVHLDAQIHENGSGPNCGDTGTACARVEINNIPKRVNMTIGKETGDIETSTAGTVTRSATTSVNLTLDRDGDPDTVELNPASPNDPAPDAPEVTVDAAVGLPVGTPVVGESPLFAHFGLLRVPENISVRMESLEHLDDIGGGEYNVTGTDLERFGFFTCFRDYDNEQCGQIASQDTEDYIGMIEASVRTFDLRPTNFPAPPNFTSPATDPLYIGVTGRGPDVEALIKIPEISEIQFLNRNGIMGATANIGGTYNLADLEVRDLNIRVDIADLSLGDSLELGDQTLFAPTADLLASVDIEPFPGELAFCKRESGIDPLPSVSGIPFTALCEKRKPFDTNLDGVIDGSDTEPDHTPQSIAFTSNTQFDLTVDVSARIDGFRDSGLNTAADPMRALAHLSLADLPSLLEVHFLQPRNVNVGTEDDPIYNPVGVFRGRMNSGIDDSGLDLDFSASFFQGEDTVCADPRVTVTSLCVSGGIHDLPTKADFFYDPSLDLTDVNTVPNIDDPLKTTNFVIKTDGPADTDFQDFKLEVVSPRRDDTGAFEGKADIILATMSLTDIEQPFQINGTVDLPDSPDNPPTAVFKVVDQPGPGQSALPGLWAHVQNFIAPDPTLGVFVPNHTRQDSWNTDQTFPITFIMRGDGFKLDAGTPLNPLQGVRTGGIRAIFDNDGNGDDTRIPLGTTAVNIGFADDFNVRAYADIQPDAANRVIADVFIQDIPQSIDVCLRGPREGAAINGVPATAAHGTWCDQTPNADPLDVASGVANEQGAIQIFTNPLDFGDELDVDAYARLQFGGGSSVLSGRVKVTNIPQIIRVLLPSAQNKDLVYRGLKDTNPGPGETLVPTGIDEIKFEAATFDILDPGFTGPLPFTVRTNNKYPFNTLPAVPTLRQYIHAAADLNTTNIYARGRIGIRDEDGPGPGVPPPSTRMHTLVKSNKPCPNVVGNTDYPKMPVNAINEYQCIYVLMEQNLGQDDVDPLDLYAIGYLPQDLVVRLRNAGFNDIPERISINTAKAETFLDPGQQIGWRRPCGAAADPDGGGPKVAESANNCMPPLIRFDSNKDNAGLFGTAEFGKRTDIDTKAGVRNDLQDDYTQGELAPQFDSVPDAAGWDTDDPSGQLFNVSANKGIRVKVVDFDNKTPTVFDDDRIAAKAGFRIQIPRSITVAQPLSFKKDRRQKNSEGNNVAGNDADDFKFGLSIRNGTGVPVESIGELSATAILADSNVQIYLSEPCAKDIYDQSSDGRDPLCPEYANGIDLPGEVGLAMYQRTALRNNGGKLRESKFIQIDGRLSTTMSVGARVVAHDLEVVPGVHLGTIEAAVRNIPGSHAEVAASDTAATFRIRAEIISDGDAPAGGINPVDANQAGQVQQIAAQKAASAAAASAAAGGAGSDVLSWVSKINIHINRVFVGFDFDPAPLGNPAKRIDAVVHLNGTKISVDVSGNSTVDPTTPGDTRVPISLVASVEISPLDYELSSHIELPGGADVADWLENDVGLPGFIADIIGWLLGAFLDVLEDFLNLFPIQVRIESDVFIQSGLDRVSHSNIRLDLLKAFVSSQGTAGGGTMIGPINIEVDVLHAGLAFDWTFDIPGWLDWLPGIPDKIRINFLLIGFHYNPFLAVLWGDVDNFPGTNVSTGVDLSSTTFANKLLIEFRGCDGIEAILPWSGNIGQFFGGAGLSSANTYKVDNGTSPADDQTFTIWPLADPRLEFTGLFLNLIDDVLDFLVEFIALPLICLIFNPQNPAGYELLSYTANNETYNPGNGAANAFEGQGVPGMPQQPGGVADTTGVPALGPGPADPAPLPPDAALTDLPPVYQGGAGVISSNPTGGLCGIHEYDTLTVSAALTVATSADPTTYASSGSPECPTGWEGVLVLQANQLTVSGSITGNNLITTTPAFYNLPPTGAPVPTDFAAYAATGNSGGTHNGVGTVGSFGDAGIRPYDAGRAYSAATIVTENDDLPAADDAFAYPGAPGSRQAGGYTDPDLTGTLASAGVAGNGGAAVILQADTQLTVSGTINMNGGDGADQVGAGACDGDPDDNGTAGLQTHPVDDDNDPDTPDIQVNNDILDPFWMSNPGLAGSKYEHTGQVGSGGGAGGAVVLEAREAITITGATITAQGGTGGDGTLGAGGGGGGGLVKMLSSIQTGALSSTAADRGADGASTPACDGVNLTKAPTYNPDTDGDPANDGDNAGDPDGELPQDRNGREVNNANPWASLRAYNPFWWPRAGSAPIDAHISGAGSGGNNTVNVVVCGVRVDAIPGTNGPANASVLAASDPEILKIPEIDDEGNPIDSSVLPSRRFPCGSRSGSSISVLSSGDTFNGAVHPEDGGITSGTINLNDSDYISGILPATSGYWGLYTTALRSTNAGNASCVNNIGLVDATDDAQCLVEPINGIEWVVGVDADNPTATISAPVSTDEFDTFNITVEFTTEDTPASPAGTVLSGVKSSECSTNGTTWLPCQTNSVISVPTGNGTKTIYVRVRDKSGNTGPSTSVSFIVDADAPGSSAQIRTDVNGTLGGGGWYTSPPEIRIYNYSGVASPDTQPYKYRWDNGLEFNPVCPGGYGTTPSAALDCKIPYTAGPSDDSVDKLATGEHTLFYTAVNKLGRRLDGNAMNQLTLKLDGEKPQVALATVPTAPTDLNVNGVGDNWFDTRPYLVASALDQVGASGLRAVDPIEISISTVSGGAFLPYNVLAPPKAPVGVSTVLVRATDVAGNVQTSPPRTIQVDDSSPNFTFNLIGGTFGNLVSGTQWYKAPPAAVATITGDTGAGTGSNPLRTRFDNVGNTDSGSPKTIAASNFPTGVHQAHASAVDKVGNRSGESTLGIWVDTQAPNTTALLSPAVPDGSNSWFLKRPWVQLHNEDPVSGVGGMARKGSLTNTIEYSLNGGASWTLYNDPFRLPAGTTNLCVRSVDFAGNAEASHCQTVKADDADPTSDNVATAGTLTPSGWFSNNATVKVVNVLDAVPGSGVNQAFDSTTDLCGHRTAPDNPLAPSGTCISVDGGPFVPFIPATGALTLGEGVHTVRSFTVDIAGRHSVVSQHVYKGDFSAPKVTLRTTPGEPAKNGWFRNQTFVTLRAQEGAQNSGLAPSTIQTGYPKIEYSIDGGAYQQYKEPFSLPEGYHTISYRAVDLRGLTGSSSDLLKLDTHPAVVKALKSDPQIWIKLLGLLGPANAKLNWEVTEVALPGYPVSPATPNKVNLKVGVIVYDLLGNVIRRLDGGTVAVTPGVKFSSFTNWDGKDYTLLGLIPAGVYYYRVVIIDEAGNVSQSGESKPITVKVGL